MKTKSSFAILFLLLILLAKVSGQNKTEQPVNIHIAALMGNIDAINKYINSGADINVKDSYGSTPLIIATIFGKTEAAETLIKAGADLSIGDNFGSTPLHIAALLCRSEIVRALLDAGVDKSIRNISGTTAYDIVSSPFEYDLDAYDNLLSGLKQFGFKLDYEQLKKIRPKISEMLKPSKEELEGINFSPIKRNDLELSTPEKVGLDPLQLSELYYDAGSLKTLYSLLVIKDGKLIGEKYFNGTSIDFLAKRASITKSFTSAMMGIAINKGIIKSVDQKMIDFFPEVSGQIKDPRKKEITIKEMLEMRAGYPWEETDTTYWNIIWSGEYITPIVKVPLTHDPDTEFQYSNLTSNWLGIIISRAAKTDLRSFGDENLFGPLKIKLGDWTRDVNGYYIGSGDMQFTTRDLAKFGLLYLNKGMYKGEQIVPSGWVKQSLMRYSENINSAGIENGKVGRYFHDIGYGYQWWSAEAGNHDFNLAWGHGGQFIILLHDLNMVIVATSDSFWGKQIHFNAWQHEKALINVLGKFIKSL